MFERQVRLPVDLMYGTSSPDIQGIPEYVKSLQHTLQEAHGLVCEKCQAEHSRQKMLYDRRVHRKMYQVGDMVLLHSCIIPRGKCIGNCTIHGRARFAFRVEDVIGESVYKIRSPKGGKPKMIHFDRLKPFFSRTDVTDVGQNDETVKQPAAPFVSSGTELLDSRAENMHAELPAVEDEPEPVRECAG